MRECPLCGACRDDDLLCPKDNQPLEESLPGPRIIDGKYVLERRLGKGGMGAVYKARHKDLQKVFALKIIRLHRLQSPGALARFRVEARALGRLQHPNIVLVTDYGVDPRSGGVPYLVMEYLEGETLLQFLEEKQSVPPDKALPIVESIAAAVDFAHSSGILHRDLKPQNIFLIGEPGSRQVKIVDFGLARIAEETAPGEEKVASIAAIQSEGRRAVGEPASTQTLAVNGQTETAGRAATDGARLTVAGTIMGTPGYIAPEILSGGAAGAPADIYAFGVLLYELLVGRKPFDHAFIGPDREGHSDSPPLPSGVRPSIPPELDAVLLSPLEADLTKRPAKAGDVVRRLKQAVAAAKHRIWRAEEKPRRMRLAGAIALALVPLFFILGRTPVVRTMENSLASFRFRFLPLRPPDDRLVFLSIDEATLRAEPVLLTEKADDMGTKLQAIMDSGASGLAIDFLLPERWNQSRAFVTFFLRNQDKLILASYITKDGEVLGPELIKGLIIAALGSTSRAESLFGFINIQPDGDGRIRRTSLGFKEKDAGWMYSLPTRAFKMLTGRDVPPAMLARPLWIDYAVDWTKIPRLSWKDLASTLEADPAYFRGRFVLVGGEYEGSQDFHSLAVRSVSGAEEVSGMVIQALTISTLLDNKPIREAPGWSIVILTAIAAMVFSSALLIRPKALSLVLAWLGVSAGYLVLCVLLFTARRILLPVALPLILWAGAAVFVFVIRRRLTFISKEGGIS